LPGRKNIPNGSGQQFFKNTFTVIVVRHHDNGNAFVNKANGIMAPAIIMAFFKKCLSIKRF